MKKYSGQAIAIIMIVLVVATVIGASLYSRMIRNQGEIIDTRESQRALEQADSILDVFLSADLLTINNAIIEALEEDSNFEITSITALAEFLANAGAITFDDEIFDWCDEGTDDSITVTLRPAAPTDTVPYDPGQVYAINLEGLTIVDGCVANFYFDGNNALFTDKLVYTNSEQAVTPYDLNHMNLYCVSANVETCGDGLVAPTASILSGYVSGNTETPLSIDLTQTDLYEVRILPLVGQLGISMVPTPECGDSFNNFAVISEVTCSGETRTMSVVLPNMHNMGYSPLFDYTIYSSSGVLTPSVEE